MANRITDIGNLLKKIYRNYSVELIYNLEQKGYMDLRPSFLEILYFVIENPEGPSIKAIGGFCGLKKQTMTGHLNELIKRGYLEKRIGKLDKREQKIYLTEYGIKFQFHYKEVIKQLELDFIKDVGEVELDRVLDTLNSFYNKINQN
jgi:DNA-binding MarR family transcriptional regulator